MAIIIVKLVKVIVIVNIKFFNYLIYFKLIVMV